MLISMCVALASYFYQLDSATKQSQELVLQVALGAQRAAAIAAYIKDEELASEILTGLEINDLIEHAYIFDSSKKMFAESNSKITPEVIIDNVMVISIDLFSPFVADEKVGLLNVKPNMKFITASARATSLQIALLLLGLSLLTALIVGLFIRHQLTNPLRNLVQEFLNVDISKPDSPHMININYKKNDEIALLIEQLNALVDANYRQFQSEHTLRKRTEELQRQFRLIFEQTNAGIGLINKSGRVTMANPAMKVFFGEDVTDRLLHNFFYPPESLKSELKKLYEKNEYSQVSVDLVAYTNSKKKHLNCLLSTIQDNRSNSRPYSEQLIEIVIHDVTSRRESEEKAQYEAAHDELTGLLNRRAGVDSLGKLIHLAYEQKRVFCLYLIDLDKFKPINDNYGHDIGDGVLVQVSERLVVASLSLQTACVRWGGDEFIVGAYLDNAEQVEHLGQNIISYIQSPMTIEQYQEIHVEASIGCIYTLFNVTNHIDPLDDYIKAADSLMYHVKQSGKNSIKLKELKRGCN